MKKFTIIEEKLIGFENGISMKVVEIMSDTESDIPEPQPEWAVGSIAYAIDTGTFCIQHLKNCLKQQRHHHQERKDFVDIICMRLMG